MVIPARGREETGANMTSGTSELASYLCKLGSTYREAPLNLYSLYIPHVYHVSLVYIYYLIETNSKMILKFLPEQRLYYLNGHHDKMKKYAELCFCRTSSYYK